MSTRRYRVVQWATGNIGMHSLRAIIGHPDLDLVGLFTYADTKVGRDAGELCGLDPTGVLATRRAEDVLVLKPDCVLFMGDRPDVDVFCQLLEAGCNVVSTRSEFHHPASLNPQWRQKIESACRRGRSTLHSTGSSPGFITEALPLVLLSLQRRLDHVSIEEYADMSSRDSPELIFKLMGFGGDPATFDPSGRAAHAGASFAGSLRMLADAISLPLDNVSASGQVAVARHSVDVAAGHLAVGTIAAQRMQVVGERDGSPLLSFSANWYLTRDIEPAWDLRETGWRVVVRGDTPLDVAIRFPVAPEDWAATSPGLTAHRPVNAIPAVCAAEPGIRTSVELTQIIPVLSR
jgi:2,4-diaminopentanoate dehydrogenase